MGEWQLLERITYNPEIFGGKAIIRGRRLAVEHVLSMMAAGSTMDELIEHFDWLEREDIQACLLYAARVVGNEHFAPLLVTSEVPNR